MPVETPMKLIAWNVNHRAQRRSIAPWIGEAIAKADPDVLILTEYVVGKDHERFMRQLAAAALAHVLVSDRVGSSNQVLVASKTAIVRGEVTMPSITPEAPANFLHARLLDEQIDVFGFRMLSFPNRHNPYKRRIWDWLMGVLAASKAGRTVIAGDFNTAPGDREQGCGDCLAALIASDWQFAEPREGYSWKTRTIDHAFLSPALSYSSARYDWDFQKLGNTTSMAPGIPDHAMLLTDIAVGVNGRGDE